MKTTRLTTFWEIDQVLTVINLLDDLKHALAHTYRHEIEHYREEQLSDAYSGPS